MTTNIFDSNSHIMATDSRWSIQFAGWLMYVDDIGYDKIVAHNNKVLMFAGLGIAIQRWKDWISSNPTSPLGMPEHRGMAVCMVDAKSQKVDFEAHQDIIDKGVYCAGSGARYAYGCWVSNKSAHKAVETAKSLDYFSGGEIKFFNFKDKTNNLTQKQPLTNITIATVDAAIKEGGQIMKINVPPPGNPPFSMASISANDNDAALAVEQIRSKIDSGELSANAPCDGMYNDWSTENKAKFNQALSEMFGWES